MVKRRWVLRAGAAVAALVLLGLSLVFWLRRPASTPEVRGKALAQKWGCFACHGEGGLEGVPNPGSDVDIPSWSGGTAMMYLESEEDIREYIRHGHPLDEEHDSHAHRPEDHGDPESHSDHDDHGDDHESPENQDHGVQEEDEGLLSMPAYGDVLTEKEVEDLTAYVKAVSRFYPEMPPGAEKGMDVAARIGCFGCHGPSGRGGLSNTGSFKGIIPGWQSEDFAESVRGPEELRQWIMNGNIERFEKNPLAMFFLNRAKIKMPAFEGEISEEEYAAVKAYMDWMRRGKE